ncbi:MAG TPA: hypothetical protein DCO75_02670 [Fibrobacteres bacterium]|nr:hypothetical protein [Fibrobacterota bacterium]
MSILSKMPERIKIAIAVFLFCTAANAGILDQKPSGAVNDFAGILSTEAGNSLSLLSENLFKKTNVALVIVTVKDLEGRSIEETANLLFSKWGIGAKGKDEGILVLLAPVEREIRIETGYGAEGYLTDVQAKRIIRDIASPFFANKQWDKGLVAVSIACADLAAREHNVALSDITGSEDFSGSDDASARINNYKPNAATFILGALLLLFLIGTRTGRSILSVLLLSLLFSGGRSGHGSSGFGGGFGSSGGFGGGFGGGMSGGGGASGRF